MNSTAPHRLFAWLPDGARMWHLVVWVLSVLVAITWFAWWILPAF